jgi:hypothetical protein
VKIHEINKQEGMWKWAHKSANYGWNYIIKANNVESKWNALNIKL